MSRVAGVEYFPSPHGGPQQAVVRYFHLPQLAGSEKTPAD